MASDDEVMDVADPNVDVDHNYIGAPTAKISKVNEIKRLPCKSKAEFLEWLAKFQQETGVTYRVLNSRPCRGTRVVYKAKYRCQHNTYPKSHKRTKSSSKKHTGCEAKLSVTINTIKPKSKDESKTTLPTLVKLYNEHNHDVNGLMSIKFKDVSPHLKDKFLRILKSGKTPAQAIAIHRSELMDEYQEDYELKSMDRSICPDSTWVYRLYYHHKQDIEKANALDDLKNIIESTNVNAMLEILEDNNFVIAACPPLMERVHSIQESGQIVFVNSDLNRFNGKVFLFMVNTIVGALPVGFFISSSDQEDAVNAGVRNLKSILPVNAFGGRKELGPEIFLANGLEQNSLQNLFPSSYTFLCTYYVLHEVWKWLFEGKHVITNSDRRLLFYTLNQILMSETEEVFEQGIGIFIESDIVKKYNGFQRYMRSLFGKRSNWCLPFKFSSGCDSIAKGVASVFKRNVLHRSGIYNISEAFSYLYEEFPNNCTTKITEYIKKCDQLNDVKLFNDDIFNDLEVTEHTEFYSVVKDSDEEYELNVDLGVCTCTFGKKGVFCKHLKLISRTVEDSPVILSDAMKMQYYFIATGSGSIPDDLLLPPKPDPVFDVSFDDNVIEEFEETNQVEELDPKILDKLNDVQDVLKTVAVSDPSVFDKFHEKILSFKSDDSLKKALINFGTLASPKKKIISVQPLYISSERLVLHEELGEFAYVLQ